MSKEEGPMVPWELRCSHPEHCTAPDCDCPAAKVPEAELVEISGRDYLRAVERWFEFWPPISGLMETPSFNDFIETEMPPLRKSSNGDVVMRVSPQAAYRIRLLTGPHHHAILRAYAIAKDIPLSWDKKHED